MYCLLSFLITNYLVAKCAFFVGRLTTCQSVFCIVYIFVSIWYLWSLRTWFIIVAALILVVIVTSSVDIINFWLVISNSSTTIFTFVFIVCVLFYYFLHTHRVLVWVNRLMSYCAISSKTRYRRITETCVCTLRWCRTNTTYYCIVLLGVTYNWIWLGKVYKWSRIFTNHFTTRTTLPSSA